MIGKYTKQDSEYNSFLPESFPPISLIISENINQKSNEATRLIGKLDGSTLLLPDMDFFISMYIRNDATYSNQIEGTRATFVDAIEYESQTHSGQTDANDILQYIKALNFGINRLKDFPFSLRFIKELHELLMEGGRSSHYCDPGEFRKSQNWIGGTSLNNADFIPPAPNDLIVALSQLEKFIHNTNDINPVVKSGLLHAQFETLHPFLDGNGRTGRLLITLYLLHCNLLERPTLYLSSYFKKHKQVYYERLNQYHNGNVEKWLDFYLDGVIVVATEAIKTVQKITQLRFDDLLKIQTLNKTAAESAIKVLPFLYSLPIVKVSTIQGWTGFTRQGAQNVIDRFVQMGMLELKNNDQTYGKSYIYKKYIEIFN